MFDHKDAAIVFRSDFENEVAELFRLRRGEPGCRLIEQQESRIDGERAGQTDTTLFAVAQARRGAMCFIGEPQFDKHIARPSSRFGTAEALPDIADLYVLTDAHAAEQSHRLKCSNDAGAWKAVTWQPGTIAVPDHDCAGERALKSGKDVDECGLAGAVRPNKSENFAALEPDADLVDSNKTAEPDAHRLRRKVHRRASSPSLSRYCKGGNNSTVKRPTDANLPLVAARIAIGRVVWMCSLFV